MVDAFDRIQEEDFSNHFFNPFEMERVPKHNYTFYLDFYDELPSANQSPDPEYEKFLADVWVGIVLTLMVLCCVCCMCSCLLYHKFQQWKRSVEERRREDLEAAVSECESLPSYTIVSGLPTYEEALEQLKKVGELNPKAIIATPAVQAGDTARSHTTGTVQRLSVMDLFQLHRSMSTTGPPIKM